MDVHFNSIARSHGEKNGVRAGRPWRQLFVGGTAALLLLGGTAIAQTTTPKPAPVYKPTSLKAEAGLPRTPQGRPDFQGEVWESPYFAGLVQIPFITPAELVVTEAQSKTASEGFIKMISANPLTQLDPEIADLFGSLQGFPIVRGERRSRLLVLPADGKMPVTAAAQAEMQKASAAFTTTPMKADNPEDRMISERCLFNGGAAPYVMPNAWNPLQIVQTAKHVVIHTENADEVRIIPFAAAHGPASYDPAVGDAIARWEGDTLVIETINAPAGLRMRVNPFGGVIVNPEAKIIEKLTRVSKDEIVYQFTIEDPTVFSAPWLGEFSLFRSSHNRMYGSHCHEGNYGLANIMSGARYEERHGPSWAGSVTADTTEPKHSWTSSLNTAADARYWAVMTPKDGQGEARVGLRIERAPTNALGAPVTTLSELNVFAVDCAGRRVKLVSAATYAQHNLAGAKTDVAPTGDWAPAATRPAITAGVQKACA